MTAKFHLVDLAGSERAKRHQAESLSHHVIRNALSHTLKFEAPVQLAVASRRAFP